MSHFASHGTQPRFFLSLVALVLLGNFATVPARGAEPLPERRLLYVAEPGIRNYLEYGGHGLLVFDIDHGHLQATGSD